MSRLITSDTKLLVSTTATSPTPTPTAVNGMSDWQFQESRASIDVTGIEDTNKQYRAGQADCQGSFSLNVDESDAGQELVASAAAANTTLYLYYREEGTGSGKPQKKVEIQITDYSTNGGVDTALTRSVSWVAAGAVDNTAQGA